MRYYWYVYIYIYGKYSTKRNLFMDRKMEHGVFTSHDLLGKTAADFTSHCWEAPAGLVENDPRKELHTQQDGRKLVYIYIGWWFGTWFLFFHRLGIIIPTDFHIFQRGRYTTNQHNYKTIIMCLFFYVFLVYDLFVSSKSSVSVAHILMSWRVCWPLLLQVVEIIEDENIQRPSKDKWFASI